MPLRRTQGTSSPSTHAVTNVRRTFVTACDDGRVPRFIVTIEGPNFKDVQVVELPQLPGVGEPIETRFGTCLITEAEPIAESQDYTGSIVCRLP